MPDRAASRLAGLNEPFDLLVVGGGIVGAGVARDAAMRGLRVLLVERADFASGASSRSSRLLHGGLRYLAQGRIGLVHEASVEKMRLHQLAPHLAQPLPFLFPTWKRQGRPRWLLSAGVRLYDLLCGGRNLGRSSTLGAAEFARLLPGLRTERLTGGVRYFDALTNDARLVIDTLRSAALHGALVRNYVSLRDAVSERGGWRVTLEDTESGERATAWARAVVNATGAWAQSIPHSRVRLRLTKGIHVVVDRERLPVPEAVVLPEGQRILFAIPWGERVILGTTDTDYAGDPAAVRSDAADYRYVLDVFNAALPQARLAMDDLISSWAGLRPLIAPSRDASGKPSDISRSHEIRSWEPGWFDIAGGKLTTYRLMAEQAVDRVVSHLGVRVKPSRTSITPLLEGLSDSGFSTVLPPPIRREVVEHCCRQEWTSHLDDLLLRRTSWHYYHAHTADVAESASRWMAEILGWDESRRGEELTRYARTAEFPRGVPAFIS